MTAPRIGFAQVVTPSLNPLPLPGRGFGREGAGDVPDPLRHAAEAGRLDPARSLAVIRGAAEGRRCLSYADVAAASFLPWNAARRRMDPHLYALCAWSLARGGPLLSAIVVNKHLVAERRMEGRTLAGFRAMVERLGVAIGTDAAAFLRAEQDRVFDWAEKERGHDLHH